MPPDTEAEFLHALAKAVARLVVAHEQGDPERAVEALRVLLNTIAAHGTVESRKSTALMRALDIGC